MTRPIFAMDFLPPVMELHETRVRILEAAATLTEADEGLLAAALADVDDADLRIAACAAGHFLWATLVRLGLAAPTRDRLRAIGLQISHGFMELDLARDALGVARGRRGQGEGDYAARRCLYAAIGRGPMYLSADELRQILHRHADILGVQSVGLSSEALVAASHVTRFGDDVDEAIHGFGEAAVPDPVRAADETGDLLGEREADSLRRSGKGEEDARAHLGDLDGGASVAVSERSAGGRVRPPP